MDEQSNPGVLFIVEEDDDDRLFLAFELQGSGLEEDARFFSDIHELLAFSSTASKKSLPSLILISAFMQSIDIQQAVALIKNVQELQAVPIVVMLGAKWEKAYLRSSNLNVSGYITKPVISKILKRFLGIK